MGTEIIGQRRLYRALGIKMDSASPIQMDSNLGEERQSVWVYLGPRPRFNVVYSTSDRFLIPGESCFSKIESRPDPNETPYKGSLFVEIAVLEQIRVADALSRRFRNDDVPARHEILSHAEALLPKHSPILDLLAGLIGLRFHKQLVLEQLSQESIGLRENNWVHGLGAPWIELLVEGKMSPIGANALAKALEQVSKEPLENLKRAGEILSWLLRAWATRDIHSKFLMLFIPLEMILAGVKVELPDKERSLATRITELIVQHGGDRCWELSEFLERSISQLRPSLSDRFEILANCFEGPRCARDIDAFRKFNKIRNSLLHRGSSDVNLLVTVGDQVQPLEDLVERYVSKTLFGDWTVYQSVWRKSGSSPFLVETLRGPTDLMQRPYLLPRWS